MLKNSPTGHVGHTRTALRSTALLALALGLVAACGSDAAPTDEADTSSRRPSVGRDVGEGDEDDAGRALPDASDSGAEPADALVDGDEPDTGAPDAVGQDARPVPDVSSPRDTGGTPDAGPADVAAVDTGPGVVTAEVRAAMDAAVLASDDTRDTFCGCYQSGDPYNGDEAACQAELDGVSVTILPCDESISATWPDDALAFYECRRTVADSLNTCFATCSSRSSAILSCVPTNAIAAVRCRDDRSEAFATAYEACHP